jgi:hypothetical protein
VLGLSSGTGRGWKGKETLSLSSWDDDDGGREDFTGCGREEGKAI